MPGIYQPFQITIGQIVGVYQGTNHYEVITDFGRFRGTYSGTSRGPGGIVESGTIVAGTYVWVAFNPGEWLCHIIATTLPIFPMDSAVDPQQPSVYPQVSGFKSHERAIGRMYDQTIHQLTTRPNDAMHDLVNGEWAMTSPHGGGGVGVELFRSWIRGGPYCGLWCWHDSQVTRLAGLDFEFLTLAETAYDRRLGNAIVDSAGRVFYPYEAVQDMQPRTLELGGAVHGGRHRFVAPSAERGVARPALFHEFVGTDGSYSVTSAAGVYLQRYAGIVVPEESQAEVPSDPALLEEQPLDEPDVREGVVTDPRKALTGDADGLTWAQRALDVVHSVTSFKGRGGVERLPEQWPDNGSPEEVPADLTHTVYTADMWRRMPRAAGFDITVDEHEKTKRFYVGRSLVALMPDGSVLVEDAFHSQVLMSGGSVMISAPNDIVLAAGRNLVAIAGRDAGLRANRHIDVAANTGRVSVKAEDQLALLGANGGQGGVLIESRSTADTSKSGTGTDQQIGGIVLKSKTGLYGEGTQVGVTATSGDLVLQALTGDTVVKSVSMTFKLDNQMLVAVGEVSHYSFLADSATMPGQLSVDGPAYVSEGFFVDGDIAVDGNVSATGGVGAVGGVGQIKSFNTSPYSKQADTLQTLAGKLVTAAITKLTKLLGLRTPLNQELSPKLGFSFMTSQQLNLDHERSFELPESRWQTIARRGNRGASETWVEKTILSPAGDSRPTSALPGYEAWSTQSTFRLHNVDLFVDLATGEVKPATDETEPELENETNVTVDRNYRIGKKP
jgi:hypothetical protein